ncbi:hypothetical protein [Bradyrhizobium sp. RDT46]|uniref:hypothetical protein n=1 Tax=Bradyrhizobium sp. RDT46 TaxID=3341829 RepID=UPI0035C67923
MNRLVEIRSQESLCRERAALDLDRRLFWLAQAEEWEQRALDEIAYHFRECNLDQAQLARNCVSPTRLAARETY